MSTVSASHTTDYFVVADEHVYSQLADEIVILDVVGGRYYGLNAVGAAIWHVLQKPHSFDRLCDAIMAEYDVEREQCAADTHALLDQLLHAGLVRRTEAL